MENPAHVRCGHAQWVSPILFLALLFGFTAVNLLTPDKAESEVENRPLQQRPELSTQALVSGKFMKETDDWLTDQFFWRDGFVGLKTTTEFAAGKRDTNGVYFSADGYLIEKHDILARDSFERNLNHLEKFADYAAKTYGPEHLRVLIAPTAGEILQSKLPPYAQNYNQPELLAEMKARMPEGTWVDMLSAMRAHSDEYVYYKTDHHWTTDGAYYGYRAYCDSVGLPGWEKDRFRITPMSDAFYGTIYSKARLPNTPADVLTAYFPKEPAAYQIDHNLGERQTEGLYVDSWLSKKDKYSYFLGGNDALLTITGPNKNGKSLLLVKDSFAHSMTPFLANEYETLYVADLRYFNMPLVQFLEEHPVTDLLVLYNLVTFASDDRVLRIDQGVA